MQNPFCVVFEVDILFRCFKISSRRFGAIFVPLVVECRTCPTFLPVAPVVYPQTPRNILCGVDAARRAGPGLHVARASPLWESDRRCNVRACRVQGAFIRTRN